MKKSVIAIDPPDRQEAQQWLNLDNLADVEVTSEDLDHPVESVFASGQTPGWRAAHPGQQTIALRFHQPQSIRQIHLEFSETRISRTQEFTLRWSSSADHGLHEIVRQQWNFSPQGSNRQVEDYRVNLSAVVLLELTLNPDVSGAAAIASLDRWQVA